MFKPNSYVIIAFIFTTAASVLRENKYIAYVDEVPTLLPNPRNYTTIFILDTHVAVLQPPYLSNLENVKELVLGNARYLREIKKGVLDNSNLQRLKVYISRLKRIDDDALDNMPKLVQVSLIYGRLVKISSKWFRNSHNVEEFILSHNRVRSLTRVVFRNIYNVKYLSLDHNEISFICPHAFWGLSKVETIILTNNKIHSIDRVTFAFQPRLVSLDLSKNNVSCFEHDVLSAINEVKEVWLSKDVLDHSCVLKIRRYYRNFRLI